MKKQNAVVKKVFSLILGLVMVIGLAAPVMASEPSDWLVSTIAGFTDSPPIAVEIAEQRGGGDGTSPFTTWMFTFSVGTVFSNLTRVGVSDQWQWTVEYYFLENPVLNEPTEMWWEWWWDTTGPNPADGPAYIGDADSDGIRFIRPGVFLLMSSESGLHLPTGEPDGGPPSVVALINIVGDATDPTPPVTAEFEIRINNSRANADSEPLAIETVSHNTPHGVHTTYIYTFPIGTTITEQWPEILDTVVLIENPLWNDEWGWWDSGTSSRWLEGHTATFTSSGLFGWAIIAEEGSAAVIHFLVNIVADATITAPNLTTASGWAHDSINQAFALGLIPAALQNNYTANATRAEFAALAVALYETITGTEITGRMQFNDTSDINVEKMGYLEVVGGVGEGNFAPDSGLTRQEAAVMLARMATILGQPLPQAAPTFADNSQISSWALDAVGQMQHISFGITCVSNN